MINIENCTVTEFGSGYKVTANEGYGIYNKRAYKAWEDYCKKHEENAEAYPEKSLVDFIRLSSVVYLSANSDGSNYGVMEIGEDITVR